MIRVVRCVAAAATTTTKTTTTRVSRGAAARRACSAGRREGDGHDHTRGATRRDGGPVTWPVLGACALMGTGALMYYSGERERQLRAVTRTRTVGKAAIGGAFELRDARGDVFTQQRLVGKWSVIYFGFTMCPDICPAEMSKIGDALRMLQKGGIRVGEAAQGDVLALFVTVDPQRDDAARADEYAKMFHPAFVGLGGSEQQIAHMAKQYRVYYSRDQGADDDYLVDHSIITYLMDPDGQFVEFYGKNCSAAEMAAKMRTHMLAHAPRR